MSRSNNTDMVNPSTRWFEWSGGEGKINYYDKATKERVEVTMPFTFLLLEELSTITGFNEKSKSRIYANEVKDLSKNPLRVMEGSSEIARGLYNEIKEKVTSASVGGKYAKSCYIAYKNEKGELVIGNFMFSGSSFGGGEHVVDAKKKFKENVGAWLDFAKAFRADLYKKAVRVTRDDRPCTNGNVTFYAPKFELVDISPETDEKAIELDKQLQEYLSYYFAKGVQPTASAPAPEDEAPAGSGRSSQAPQDAPPINEEPWKAPEVDDLPF
jgi:hypothetical protein